MRKFLIVLVCLFAAGCSEYPPPKKTVGDDRFNCEFIVTPQYYPNLILVTDNRTGKRYLSKNDRYSGFTLLEECYTPGVQHVEIDRMPVKLD